MGTMTKQTSTPGYYTIPELTDKDLASLKYPVHVAKVTSPSHRNALRRRQPPCHDKPRAG